MDTEIIVSGEKWRRQPFYDVTIIGYIKDSEFMDYLFGEFKEEEPKVPTDLELIRETMQKLRKAENNPIKAFRSFDIANALKDLIRKVRQGEKEKRKPILTVQVSADDLEDYDRGAPK